jgi:hypothetical protein
VALIREGEPSSVFESEERVRMLRERGALAHEPEASGHAKVRDERLAVVEPDEYVLAASADLDHARAAQTSGELARRSVGRETGPQELRRLEAKPAHRAFERARDEFYFGKFGHGVRG